MAFKLFTQAQARAFGQQIINQYSKVHNIPFLGAGIVLPSTPKRIKNKESQQLYRTAHSRMIVWDNADNAAILAPVKIKLQAIRETKKAWRAQKATLSGFIRQMAKIQAKTLVGGYTAAMKAADIATKQAEIDAQQIVVGDKLALFNAAKAA